MRHFLNNILSSLKKGKKTTSASDSKKQTKLAAAVIMLEAAYADDNCSRDELDHIKQTIQITFDLSQGEAEEVIEHARKSREEEVDLWQFTNQINESLNEKERLKIIEAVWEIIYIDGHLEQHEDHFVHQLARLLRLSHNELIEAKMAVKARI